MEAEVDDPRRLGFEIACLLTKESSVTTAKERGRKGARSVRYCTYY